jgi:hypothetical protein
MNKIFYYVFKMNLQNLRNLAKILLLIFGNMLITKFRIKFCISQNRKIDCNIHPSQKISAVSLRPRNPILRSHWNRGIWSRSLIETASMVSIETANLLQKFSFWILGPRWNRGIRSRDHNKTAESEFANDYLGITRRIQSQMRNGFSPWIMALGGMFDEKNGPENLMTLP